MALLTEQAKQMAGEPSGSRKCHHEASPSFMHQRENDIFQLTQTIERFGNPFEDDGETLVNLVTKKVASSQIQHDLLNCKIIGKERHDTFVSERIESDKVNLWSRLPKTQLKTWKSGNKTKSYTAADAKVIELTEDRALFGRMAIIAKSRPELNIRETIGEYELSVVPRSLFAPDGTMLYCSNKSVLSRCVIENSNIADSIPSYVTQKLNRSIIVDAMAEVQCLEKDDTVEPCADLASVFVSHIFGKFSADKDNILYRVS